MMPIIMILLIKELIDGSDSILTLTAEKAYEYGIARAVVSDVNGVLDFLAKRDNVNFAGPPIMLDTTWSEELARWLNSTAVMAILGGACVTWSLYRAYNSRYWSARPGGINLFCAYHREQIHQRPGKLVGSGFIRLGSNSASD